MKHQHKKHTYSIEVHFKVTGKSTTSNYEETVIHSLCKFTVASRTDVKDAVAGKLADFLSAELDKHEFNYE